jgi:hypothetical protein
LANDNTVDPYISETATSALSRLELVQNKYWRGSLKSLILAPWE